MQKTMSTLEKVQEIFYKKFGRIIGDKDDLFECGGSSIVAIEILSEIESSFEKTITFLDIENCFTISSVVEIINNVN